MAHHGYIASYDSVQCGSIADKVPIFGTSDSFGIRFFAGCHRNPGILKMGTVVGYNPQCHSASVQIWEDQSIWACEFADEFASYSFGFSDTCPPREGESVLVYEAGGPNSQIGAIIGRLPFHWDFSQTGDIYGDPDQYHRRLFTQLDDTKDRNIQCYTSPLSNENDDSTKQFTHFRPTDVYPGEFAKVNQHNCGIKGGLFSATLLGGGASLRLSGLSNMARLACDSYRRISMLGHLHEFHNGRYLSSERNVSLYQEERLGGCRPNDEVWTDDSEAPKEGESQTSRPRIKDLSGYFGNLSAKFCLRPDPNESGIRTLGSESNEEGVFRETIDPSGQYRVSASGMLTLERTGRIPVPVRICNPTDKGHDISSDPETLTSFKHDESDPCYRQLELFDRQAYDLKTQYSRVDGLGTEDPDYHVPQEDEMEPLIDRYDERFTGSETVKLNKFDKRRAGVYIGEDGSVILRDAWGSEIVMLAGNVTISCAGNVMMLPGKTQLTIAGDDIVQKAQNSVDIHASAHDVRLSAARNMEIVGGADEKEHRGGVIIESKGSSPSPWDGKGKGESASVSGITLKAKKQAVVVDGQNVVVRSRKQTRILSGKKDLDGTIGIGARYLISRTSRGTLISSGEKGHLVVGPKSVNAVADQVLLAGESSTNIFKGEDYLVPLEWVPTRDVASEFNPRIDKNTKKMIDEKQSSLGFDSAALDKMMFGFRTSAECNTTSPWAIGGSGNWKMYEPAWVQVKGIYETLRNGGVDTEAYKEDGKWENGRPFPGEEAESSGEYVHLSGLAPANLTSDGFNVSRESVKDESDITSSQFIDGYLVRK